MSTYGERLKHERLRLKLTQAQMADAGGVKRQAQGCYERDVSLPRAPYLAAITLLGVDVLFIITGRPTLQVGAPIQKPNNKSLPSGC
ncbi:helix-turn-helix domain-containing protein [Pseudomonas helleri]|uniref:XRE family transcriptional regulator n=1 Tax=Pseudomonas helleri TaxID=1608996 RepID=A0A6A7YQZ9_9PSED|nr:helix-turn-helix transcriptional regulator [Pseudomonas helleri]MQT25530.1 XRE family transcriptional regulator [Pseudomonas helleri]MQT79392.1 XRE family transcriptional regulator [Pseudomonas helleri]MQU16162.1 XRE family transcriptional regulator [Pseudomonas helleri]MQU28262.1 XRE family transcriptional regulator [Pseudomonas helleri]